MFYPTPCDIQVASCYPRAFILILSEFLDWNLAGRSTATSKYDSLEARAVARPTKFFDFNSSHC